MAVGKWTRMNADGPRNLSVLAPFYPACDGSHSHHPRSVCIRIHLPQRRIEEFQFGHLRFAGLWFSLLHHAGDLLLVAADSTRPALGAAWKPRDAAPLWRGRGADSGEGTMRVCGAHLPAGKPRTAGFQPAPSARLWRNEFRAPGGGLPPHYRARLPGCFPSPKIPPNRENLSPNRSNSNFNAIQAFIKPVQASIKAIQARIKTIWFGVRAVRLHGKKNLSCLEQKWFDVL